MTGFKPPQARRNAPESLWELLNLGNPDTTGWVSDALCAQTDPAAFYPERGESTGPAKAVCLACPVRAECLTSALDNGETHGIWGGQSPRQRKATQRKRAAAAAQSEVAA